jgi:hypothetical protein
MWMRLTMYVSPVTVLTATISPSPSSSSKSPPPPPPSTTIQKNHDALFAAATMGLPEALVSLLKRVRSPDSLARLSPSALMFVPTSTILKGRDAVRKYVIGSKYVEAPHIKVVLLGNGTAGKTTLVLALKKLDESALASLASSLTSSLTWFAYQTPRMLDLPDTNRTVGIDIGDGPKRLDPRIAFTFYDMAGQLEYMSCHQVPAPPSQRLIS